MWLGSREQSRDRLRRTPHRCKFRMSSSVHHARIARSQQPPSQIQGHGRLCVFGRVIPRPGLSDPPDIMVGPEHASYHHSKTETVMLKSKARFSLLVPAPMRTPILAATLMAMTVGMIPLATPADAQGASWCARRKGNTNCAYQTREQCQASISGRGGTCVQRKRR
jgi:hypothetical protein